MAINTKYLESKALFPYDFLVLQLISQNTGGEMANYLHLYLNSDVLTRLLTLDLITKVKAKNKSQHDYDRLRLSKKGREIFRNAQIEDYTEQDELLLDYLTKLYHSIEKPIGNEERIKQLLAWFRVETGALRKDIYYAVKTYLSTFVDNSKTKYIPSLENLIWKPNSVFATKWTLADSKLYQFIRENNIKISDGDSQNKR